MIKLDSSGPGWTDLPVFLSDGLIDPTVFLCCKCLIDLVGLVHPSLVAVCVGTVLCMTSWNVDDEVGLIRAWIGRFASCSVGWADPTVFLCCKGFIDLVGLVAPSFCWHSFTHDKLEC
jgi:hypothetical protein